MNTLQQPAPRTLPRVPVPRPEDRHEPTAGLWAYRLAQGLTWSVLLAIVPMALAVGLGWVRWNEAEPFVPALRQIALIVWVVSLLGLILAGVGLSQFGPKRRTLQGLLVHLTLTLGPFIVTVFLR